MNEQCNISKYQNIEGYSFKSQKYNSVTLLPNCFLSFPDSTVLVYKHCLITT